MADIVSRETRSKMMSRIRGKDTKPELLIRKGLFSKGYRYRLHDKRLPGKPDLIFPKYKAVIFVHGCFWHGHDCHLFRMPQDNRGFWENKITTNKAKDEDSVTLLKYKDWRILTIWECALKGKTRLPLDSVINSADSWLKSNKNIGEIKGKIA